MHGTSPATSGVRMPGGACTPGGCGWRRDVGVSTPNSANGTPQVTFGAADAKELLALLEEGAGAEMSVGAAKLPAADITSAVVRPSR